MPPLSFRPYWLSLLLVACGSPARPPREANFPDLRLQQVTMRSWSAGALKAVTTATQLDVLREDDALSRVRAVDAGVELAASRAHLFAPLVTGHIIQGHFLGEGGVRLEGQQGLRARSPQVSFERSIGAQGQIASDAGLMLNQPGLDLQAASFSIDVAEERADFDQVQTRFTSSASP